LSLADDRPRGADTADRALEGLAKGAIAWKRLSPIERAAILRRCMTGVLDVAPEWAALGCRAKGIEPASVLAGEEWLAGPMTTLRGFRLTAETLERVERPVDLPMRTGPGGRTVVSVFPASLLDRVLYLGIEGEVWFAPGSAPTRARIYRDGAAAPAGIAAVLGAGNVSSIAPLDVLYMLAAEGQVAVLKLNPVADYLRPVFEHAFKPLIDPGYLAIVSGDGALGDYVCRHPAVSRVHLTGSRRTYDAIMWGAGAEERAARKAAGTPRLDKPCTAELGCVTPILVVPGEWSDADLDFQARHVAAMVAHNASFNCVAGKVLVLARGWAQRQAFLDRVERALADTPPRLAYYPGAQERYAGFLARYPAARAVGPQRQGVVPWTVLPDVPPAVGEYALSEEAFCGVLATTTIDGDDAPSFLAHAVPFANDHVEGTLSCMLLVHPKTANRHKEALDNAEAGLRYGSVATNLWSGVVFGIGSTTWGAHPGHTPADVGSGIGAVHNTFLFDAPEKSVVRGLFRLWPTPVWFADHRTLDAIGRKMTAFEAEPSWLKLPSIFASAIRG
jgi:acyl-CoA reductase-like NAD-dependent aldehyde dehydrogenase